MVFQNMKISKTRIYTYACIIFKCIPSLLPKPLIPSFQRRKAAQPTARHRLHRVMKLFSASGREAAAVGAGWAGIPYCLCGCDLWSQAFDGTIRIRSSLVRYPINQPKLHPANTNPSNDLIKAPPLRGRFVGSRPCGLERFSWRNLE
jgi:hypothetical protein